MVRKLIRTTINESNIGNIPIEPRSSSLNIHIREEIEKRAIMLKAAKALDKLGIGGSDKEESCAIDHQLTPVTTYNHQRPATYLVSR